jgi:uncharacterized protein (TIGR03437 family)
LLLATLAPAQAIITTFAGTGEEGNTGDGGPAIAARLSIPRALAFDPSGNLYIADDGNRRIRRVNPAGIINAFVGGFSSGGLAVDSAGNVYASDWENHRVYRFTPAGTMTTVAGTGVQGFSGDGGPATAATLNQPQGMAFDAAGNLYIADSQNHRVRRVTPAGVISTYAGNGARGFSGDGGLATAAAMNWVFDVAVDRSGNLYIADNGNRRVRRVAPTGIITTVAGNGSGGNTGDGGPATSATFGPTILTAILHLAVDSAGDLYVSDEFYGVVRKVTGGIISKVAGAGGEAFSGDGGLAVNAQLARPDGLAFDAVGNLYIGDSYNDRVRKVSTCVPAAGAPAVNPGGVVDGAAYKPTIVAGSIFSAYGTNLAPRQEGAASVPLPTTLGGARFLVDGIPAPLFFTSQLQINAQVPWEIAGRTQAAAGVEGGCPVVATLAARAPAIFTYDGTGSGQGAILIAGTSLFAGPPGPTFRPAAPGEFLTIYATGLGAVSNQPASGAAAPGDPLARTSVLPTVTIGGITAGVSFSGLAPGFVGLYQINVQIPFGAPRGNTIPVVLTIGGAVSNTVTIAVQ